MTVRVAILLVAFLIIGLFGAFSLGYALASQRAHKSFRKFFRTREWIEKP